MRCGIDVGGTKIETAILSDSGEFLFRERIDTPDNYTAMIHAIKAGVDLAADDTGYDGPVLGYIAIHSVLFLSYAIYIYIFVRRCFINISNIYINKGLDITFM